MIPRFARAEKRRPRASVRRRRAARRTMRKGRASLTAQAVASAAPWQRGRAAALIRFRTTRWPNACCLRRSRRPRTRLRRRRHAATSPLPCGPGELRLRRSRRAARGDDRPHANEAAAGAAACAQVVILGAGLDTRAHRLSALRATTVYEVDHPDGQRQKRERARRSGCARPSCATCGRPRARRSAGEPHRGRLHARAAELLAGRGPRALPEPNHRRQHVAQIAGVARPGSQLLITYVTPELSMLRHARKSCCRRCA